MRKPDVDIKPTEPAFLKFGSDPLALRYPAVRHVLHSKASALLQK